MKKFMLIFVGQDYGDLGLSPEQIQARMGKWFAWSEKMKADGVEHEGNALEYGKVRRISGPDRTVTDRAGSELKELVGGYYVVQARDFDHAAEIAQGYPDYDLGGHLEIREVMVFS